MRKSFTLLRFGILILTCLSLLPGTNSFAQGFIPPGPSANYIFLQHKIMNGLNDARYAVRTDKTYTVDGSEVTGSPFLYDDWMTGMALTRDGREFDNLQVKYDAYEQKLIYKSGEESIIVTEPLAEFRIYSGKSQTGGNLHFKHASQFGDKRSDHFLEVLAESKSGNSLLKLNKKTIFADVGNLLDAQHNKYLDLELSFYYYNAKDRKLYRIRNDGSNLAEISSASADDLKLIEQARLDLKTEQGLIKAFMIIQKMTDGN